jgi:hypothetical protein
MNTTDENKVDYTSERGDDAEIQPLGPITIKHVFRNGAPITNELLQCFFSPEATDEYMFFEGNGDPKGGDRIKGGHYFSFKMAGKIWVLMAHFDPKKGTADGEWFSFGPDNTVEVGITDTDDGGTFTAQSGTGADYAAYASA